MREGEGPRAVHDEIILSGHVVVKAPEGQAGTCVHSGNYLKRLPKQVVVLSGIAVYCRELSCVDGSCREFKKRGLELFVFKRTL